MKVIIANLVLIVLTSCVNEKNVFPLPSHLEGRWSLDMEATKELMEHHGLTNSSHIEMLATGYAVVKGNESVIFLEGKTPLVISIEVFSIRGADVFFSKNTTELSKTYGFYKNEIGQDKWVMTKYFKSITDKGEVIDWDQVNGVKVWKRER